MNKAKPLLEVSNLSIDYIGENQLIRAVDELSFTIHENEIFGLAGESGCGKSTVAFALARLTKLPGVISSGEIVLNGENILQYNSERLRRFRWAKVSMVLQSSMNALNPVLSIHEQLTDTIRTHTRTKAKKATEQAEHLLELVGISKTRIRDFPHQFSGGMKQRICIAMALALKPKLIIMDEPTTGLDVIVQREIMGEILQLQESHGFAILFITHDLNLMAEIADTIGVMYAGKLVEVSPAKQMYQSPRHPYSQALRQAFPSLIEADTYQEGLAGQPADFSNLPSGCYFHPRCQQASELCTRVSPNLTSHADNSKIACHLYQSASL